MNVIEIKNNNTGSKGDTGPTGSTGDTCFIGIIDNFSNSPAIPFAGAMYINLENKVYIANETNWLRIL